MAFMLERRTARTRLTAQGLPLGQGGSFDLSPAPGGGCVFSAESHLGASSRLGTRLLDPLLARIVPLRALEEHMREVAETLDALATCPSPPPTGAPAPPG